MVERQSSLGISEASFRKLSKRFDFIEKDFFGFYQDVLINMEREQPDLYKRMILLEQNKNIKNLATYRVGLSYAYELLPNFHKEEALTPDEVDDAMEMFGKRTMFKDINRKQIAEVDLSWLMNEFRKDSPLFANWLITSADTLNEEGKKSLLWGALNVAVPFYMREEARKPKHEPHLGNVINN